MLNMVRGTQIWNAAFFRAVRDYELVDGRYSSLDVVEILSA
jgi:hypothetical protein